MLAKKPKKLTKKGEKPYMLNLKNIERERQQCLKNQTLIASPIYN